MASFDLINKHIFIVDAYQQRVELQPGEGIDLLHWLSHQRDVLLSLLGPDDEPVQAGAKRLELHLYPQDLGHLDELRAAIPGLHEARMMVKVFDAPWDPVTERAIVLLKELQLEYKIHPLLEDNDAFAQA